MLKLSFFLNVINFLMIIVLVYFMAGYLELINRNLDTILWLHDLELLNADGSVSVLEPIKAFRED